FVIGGQMTGGTLTAFVLYTATVGFAIGGMSELYGQFQQAIGATRRVFELLDTTPDIRDPEAPHPLDRVSGHVEFRDVHFSYPDERDLPVLKGVNIDARSGEVIALVGP